MYVACYANWLCTLYISLLQNSISSQVLNNTPQVKDYPDLKLPPHFTRKYYCHLPVLLNTKIIPVYALSVPSQSRYKCIKCYYQISDVFTTNYSRITSNNPSK